MVKEYEGQIAKMKAELERLIPNMKAIDRYVFYGNRC